MTFISTQSLVTEKLSLDEIVDLYGKAGFGAIAITDHLCEEFTFLGKAASFLDRPLLKSNFQYYLDEVERVKKKAMEDYGMLVIAGVEFTKNAFRHDDSAHILGLGVKKYISPDLPVEKITKEIRRQGGIAVAAHPVSTQRFEPQTYFLWKNKELLADCFDAWEVASGPFLFEQVHQSGLPLLANSDLHCKQQMSSWKTLLRAEKNQEDVFDAIRCQKNIEFKFFNYH